MIDIEREKYFVMSIRKLKPSSVGHPRFKLNVVDKDGNEKILHTRRDRSWVYKIDKSWEKRMIDGVVSDSVKRNYTLEQATIAENTQNYSLAILIMAYRLHDVHLHS